MSGPLANTGRYYRDGYEFAVDQINKLGRRQGWQRPRANSSSSCSTTSRTTTSRAPVRAVADAGQGQSPAWPVRQRCRARQLVGRRKVPGADGPGRRRVGPDLQPRLQIHLRHAAVGEQVFREHDRGHGQALAGAEVGGAAVRRRCVRRVGREGHARAAGQGGAQDRHRRALQHQRLGLRVAAVADQERASRMPCWSPATRPRS